MSNILSETEEEAIKYHYFDQVKVDLGQWNETKRQILFVTEFATLHMKQAMIILMHTYSSTYEMKKQGWQNIMRN